MSRKKCVNCKKQQVEGVVHFVDPEQLEFLYGLLQEAQENSDGLQFTLDTINQKYDSKVQQVFWDYNDDLKLAEETRKFSIEQAEKVKTKELQRLLLLNSEEKGGLETEIQDLQTQIQNLQTAITNLETSNQG